MADEKELIERAGIGDGEAFADIVRHHQDRVFRVCLAALGDRQAADEAAQDVFVRLFDTIGRFRGDSLLSTWLYRVALNICADRRRSRWWRRRLQIDPADVGDVGSWGAGGDINAVSADRPDRRLEDADATRELLAALRKLPAIFSEVLILREMEDREYVEIAEILGISIGTVESRLHRARAKLKALMVEGASDNGA